MNRVLEHKHIIREYKKYFILDKVFLFSFFILLLTPIEFHTNLIIVIFVILFTIPYQGQKKVMSKVKYYASDMKLDTRNINGRRFKGDWSGNKYLKPLMRTYSHREFEKILKEALTIKESNIKESK